MRHELSSNAGAMAMVMSRKSNNFLRLALRAHISRVHSSRGALTFQLDANWQLYRRLHISQRFKLFPCWKSQPPIVRYLWENVFILSSRALIIFIVWRCTPANDELAANVVVGNVIALHSIPSPSLTNSLQLYLIFFRMWFNRQTWSLLFRCFSYSLAFEEDWTCLAVCLSMALTLNDCSYFFYFENFTRAPCRDYWKKLVQEVER